MFGRRKRGSAEAEDGADHEKGTGDDLAGHRPHHALSDTALAGLKHNVTDWSRWTLRLLIIGVGLWVVFLILGQLWSVLLPIFFGLLLATVLWPPVRFMRRKLPNALAAILALVGLLVIFGGLIAVLAPQVTSQAGELADRAIGGLTTLQQWLAGPPFNLGPNALGGLVDKGIAQIQSNSQEVVAIVIGSLGAIGSAIITLVLALVLCFFILKDGPRFVPWLQTWINPSGGKHFAELSDRVWTALGQYVWSQAAVAAVDGIFIGLGVWILGVPFALPIGVLTFFGGFVPIVGAFVAGSVAVLVALVSNGIWTAVGGTLFGIVGAFLAVPAVAVVQVVARYVREQLQALPPDPDARTGPAAKLDDGLI